MKRLLRIFMLGYALAGLPACATPSVYSAESIRAWVVDAETKQPLEGVVVVAHWQLFYSTVGGRVPGGQLMVLESITDRDGKYTFPAWGPKKVPQYKPQKGDIWMAHIPFFVPDSYLDNRDPQLLLFKSGYEYQRLANEVSSKTNMASVRRSQWNGKAIEMKKFKGTIQAYKGHFESLNNDLEHIAADNPEECGWKKIPNTIRAMNRERMHLVAQSVNPNTLSSIDKRLLMNDEYFAQKGGCGSPRAFFKDLRQ